MEEKSLSRNYREYYEKAVIFPQQEDEKEVELFAGLAPGTGMDILDLGCAEGKLAVRLAQRGHQVSVADIAESQLRRAEASGRRNGVALRAYQCDIEAGIEAFQGRKFDVIFFMDIVEHLRNPVRGLENARALLKDDGRLILHTPNACTPYRFLWHLFRRGPAINYYNPDKLFDFHFQTYDYLTLEKTLNFIGFKIAKVIPTRIAIPRVFTSRLLAKLFPLLSDTLLCECRKVPPIDLDSHMEHWKKSHPLHEP